MTGMGEGRLTVFVKAGGDTQHWPPPLPFRPVLKAPLERYRRSGCYNRRILALNDMKLCFRV